MEYERVIKLSEEMTSQGNRANLTQKEALLWAIWNEYCQEAARLRAGVDKDSKKKIQIAEIMIDIISDTGDYKKALEKIANYIRYTTQGVIITKI